MLSEIEQTTVDTWVAQNGAPARHGPPSVEDVARRPVSKPQTQQFRPSTPPRIGAPRKISDDKVRAIRADTRPAREVAAEHGISLPTVYQIRQCRMRQDAGGCAGRVRTT